MARTNVPKFGNWENEDNVSYTTYFENARRGSSTDKVKLKNSPDNANAVSKQEALRRSEPARAKPEGMVSQEHGELQRPADSPSHDGGRRAFRDSTHQRPAGVSSDTPKRAGRSNGGGSRSVDHSPLHPHYQAKINAKASSISSPSRERKVSSEGSHGLAPSTPGRSRLKSVPRGNETPDRGTSVPKFGEWDETDPSSADGFTHIFNKVKEERHGSGNASGVAAQTQRSNYGSKDSKGCCCFPWGGN